MGQVRSNLTTVVRGLKRATHALDFTSPYRGHTFGDELLDLIAERIHTRAWDEQRDPDGADFAPNEPRYAASPQKRGKRVGELTGEMLSPEQIAGDRDVSPLSASMRYGLDETNRLKMEWFSMGRDPVQPARRVYEFSETDEDALEVAIRARLDSIRGVTPEGE